MKTKIREALIVAITPFVAAVLEFFNGPPA
jgi:hypothetical protein